MIVEALGQSYDYTDLFGQNITFGPVFQPDFLKALLKLQQAIENMETPSGLKLKDVSHSM